MLHQRSSFQKQQKVQTCSYSQQQVRVYYDHLLNVLFALFPEITLIENYGFVDSFTDLQIERLIVELNE